MTASRTILRRFMSDQAGASAVEYGLLVGLIAVAIMGGSVRCLSTVLCGTVLLKVCSNSAIPDSESGP